MKLDEIFAEWKKDCVIDQTDLANESIKIPNLHAKYLEYYTKENLLFKKYEAEHKRLYKQKLEYYSGKLPDKEKEQLDWKKKDDLDILILKTDLDVYIDADDDVIESLLKMSLQKEKVNVLKGIVESLKFRNITIRTALDYLKWTSGA